MSSLLSTEIVNFNISKCLVLSITLRKARYRLIISVCVCHAFREVEMTFLPFIMISSASTLHKVNHTILVVLGNPEKNYME